MRNDARQPAAWVSISEYARTYGLSRTTVYELIALDKLKTYQVEGFKVLRVLNVCPSLHVASEIGHSSKVVVKRNRHD